MSSNQEPNEALTEIIELTRQAGEIAQRWQGRVTALRKADGSMATEADLETEQFIVQHLQQLYPEDAICSEESLGQSWVGTGRLWSVDPIDGTHNFIAGLGLWAVSVGLIEGGRTVLGVVHSPPLELTFAAAAGEGAWLNGEPLSPPSAEPVSSTDLVGVTTDLSWRALEIPHKNRNLGTAALHACWVISGVFRAALLSNWALWDLAAALCLAAETKVEVRWPDGTLLEDLSEMDPSSYQGLVVMAPQGLGEALTRKIRTE